MLRIRCWFNHQPLSFFVAPGDHPPHGHLQIQTRALWRAGGSEVFPSQLWKALKMVGQHLFLRYLRGWRSICQLFKGELPGIGVFMPGFASLIIHSGHCLLERPEEQRRENQWKQMDTSNGYSMLFIFIDFCSFSFIYIVFSCIFQGYLWELPAFLFPSRTRSSTSWPCPGHQNGVSFWWI